MATRKGRARGESYTPLAGNAKNNFDNRHECIARIWWIYYFQSENSDVRIFGKPGGNAAFLYLCRREIKSIQKAETAGSVFVVSNHRSRDILRLYRVQEVDEVELRKLFFDKFAAAKNSHHQFKSEPAFARHLLREIPASYPVARQWLPGIFDQWERLLRDIDNNFLSQEVLSLRQNQHDAVFNLLQTRAAEISKGVQYTPDSTIREQKDALKLPVDHKPRNLTLVTQIALYHRLLQLYEGLPLFKKENIGKEMREAGKQYNVSGDSFRNHYYAVLKLKIESTDFGSKLTEKQRKKTKKDLEQVLKQLEFFQYNTAAKHVNTILNRLN